MSDYKMDEKLRSYFYLGKFDSLLKYQGKKSEDVSLLVERALVLMSKPTSLKHPNLDALVNYTKTEAVPSIISGPFDETLALILSFNNNRESNILDSITAKSLESKLFILLSLIKLRRIDIAEENLKTYLQNDEEEGALVFLQACVLFLKGEIEESSSVISELISKYEESAVLLNLLSLNLIEEGNYAQAETRLRKALDLARQNEVKEQVQTTLKNLIACKRLQGEDFQEFER